MDRNLNFENKSGVCNWMIEKYDHTMKRMTNYVSSYRYRRRKDLMKGSMGTRSDEDKYVKSCFEKHVSEQRRKIWKTLKNVRVIDFRCKK